MAAKIEITVAEDFGCGKVFDNVDRGGVEEVIVVPGDLGGVHEDGDIWKRVEFFVEVVDYVGEEDHGFVAFV